MQIIVGVLSSAVLVRRFERRTLFVASSSLSLISLSVLGGYLFALERDPVLVQDLKWLPLCSLIVFISGVGIGLVPLSWLMANEVLPSKFRGPGYSIVCFVFYISGFTVTKTFIDLQRALGSAGSFWFYGGFCAVAVLFGIFVLPETKGKTPEEIQEIFNDTGTRSITLE